MTHDFPPPIPMSLGFPAFALCLFGLAFVLAVCFGVFSRREVISRASRIRRVGVALGLAILIGIVGLVRELKGTQLQPWLAFWAILLGLIAVTNVVRQRRGRPAALSWCGLAVLVALLLPAGLLYKSEFSRNLGCENNLHNLSIAHANYISSHNGSLPNEEHYDWSWRVGMLSYIRGTEEDLFHYVVDVPWDADANLKIGRISQPQYECPVNPFPTDEAGRCYADIARITGPGTAFPPGERVLLTAIEKGDGLSQTLLLGECSGLNIVWTEPRDIDTATLKMGINLPGSKPRSSSSILSSYHRGGAYVLFADGSVKFLSKSIDPSVLKAMTTINGGESVEEP